MPKKLADRSIPGLKPGSHPAGGGLYLRVLPSGSKLWYYRYRNDAGADTWVPLGAAYPEQSIKKAAARAAELRAAMAEGRDPLSLHRQAQEARKEQARVAAGEYTLSALADRWYSRKIAKKHRRPEQVRHRLDKHLIPAIGKSDIRKILPVEIADAVMKIADKSPVMANRVLRDAKAIFAFAVGSGLLTFSPAAQLTRKAVGTKEEARDRTLSFTEIRALVRFLDDERTAKRAMSAQARCCLMVLVLTGQRIGETLLTEWAHLDRQAGIWTLPAANTKNGTAHTVHIAPQLDAVYAEMRKITRKSRYVFAAVNDVAEPLVRDVVTRALARALADESLKVAKFTCHDLRRTFVSRLGDLGVLPHIGEKLINHKLGGVLQVYQRGDYFPERKAALTLWADKIDELKRPDSGKVVQLPKRA
ncbi:MAG TPA: tyrosine-type recombinase/integrase [Solimonas sp.]|nr:tyrosine-type recombinase/integrase [Solimonas sp.]